MNIKRSYVAGTVTAALLLSGSAAFCCEQALADEAPVSAISGVQATHLSGDVERAAKRLDALEKQVNSSVWVHDPLVDKLAKLKACLGVKTSEVLETPDFHEANKAQRNVKLHFVDGSSVVVSEQDLGSHVIGSTITFNQATKTVKIATPHADPQAIPVHTPANYELVNQGEVPHIVVTDDKSGSELVFNISVEKKKIDATAIFKDVGDDADIDSPFPLMTLAVKSFLRPASLEDNAAVVKMLEGASGDEKFVFEYADKLAPTYAKFFELQREALKQASPDVVAINKAIDYMSNEGKDTNTPLYPLIADQMRYKKALESFLARPACNNGVCSVEQPKAEVVTQPEIKYIGHSVCRNGHYMDFKSEFAIPKTDGGAILKPSYELVYKLDDSTRYAIATITGTEGNFKVDTIVQPYEIKVEHLPAQSEGEAERQLITYSAPLSVLGIAPPPPDTCDKYSCPNGDPYSIEWGKAYWEAAGVDPSKEQALILEYKAGEVCTGTDRLPYRVDQGMCKAPSTDDPSPKAASVATQTDFDKRETANAETQTDTPKYADAKVQVTVETFDKAVGDGEVDLIDKDVQATPDVEHIAVGDDTPIQADPATDETKNFDDDKKAEDPIGFIDGEDDYKPNVVEIEKIEAPKGGTGIKRDVDTKPEPVALAPDHGVVIDGAGKAGNEVVDEKDEVVREADKGSTVPAPAAVSTATIGVQTDPTTADVGVQNTPETESVGVQAIPETTEVGVGDSSASTNNQGSQTDKPTLVDMATGDDEPLINEGATQTEGAEFADAETQTEKQSENSNTADKAVNTDLENKAATATQTDVIDTEDVATQTIPETGENKPISDVEKPSPDTEHGVDNALPKTGDATNISYLFLGILGGFFALIKRIKSRKA